MALTPAEAAELARLQAKSTEPDEDEAEPVEVAGEVAGEVGAAVADAVAEVASTVAAVTAAVVNDARADEAERLEREVNAAKVDAAVAEMRADEAERVADVATAIAVDAVAPAVDEVHTDAPMTEGDGAVIIDTGDGDDVVQVDQSPQAHPYFGKRIRMPWQHE